MLEAKIEKIIKQAIESSFSLQPESPLAIVAPDPRFGDFAFACHFLSKDLRLSPQDIASALAAAVKDEFIPHLSSNTLRKGEGFIIQAQAVAGYLNLRVNPAMLAREVLSTVIAQGRHYGEPEAGEKKKIVVEYSSPNTNKPLHLGHIRNNVLGMAVANILRAQGQEVFKTQIINDRGIHIAKAMVAYQKWGKGKTPDEEGEKGDRFVGKFYVMFNQEFEREWQDWLKKNPEAPGLPDEEKEKRKQEFFGESALGRQAQELLRLWEQGDKGTLALWRQMNSWVYEGFEETYAVLGSEFDKNYYESETYLLGKKMVEQGLAAGVFDKQADGSVWVDLTGEGLDRKILQRRDNTSVYITQDMGLAATRQEELGFDGLVYVVGHEQEYHFKVLFAILKKLGFSWADNLYHLAYGLLMTEAGKISSRLGKALLADDAIREITDLAGEEIKKRFPEILESELRERSRAIGLGALKFFILKINPRQFINYNPAEALAFEGDTGPYIQYAHARIASILKEETPLAPAQIDFSLLGAALEKRLILKLAQYPAALARAAAEYNPAVLCNYLFSLAQDFNTFYHEHQVLKAGIEELKEARVLLIKAAQIVLQSGLRLLGIAAPEKM